MMLNSAERIRFSRQLSIDGFTEEHQLRIRDAGILIVGAGALGSVAATYLTAGGVGQIGIVDFDTVDLSNLQRQVFYTEYSIGAPKIDEIARHLEKQNPGIRIDKYNIFLREDNQAREIFSKYDVIVDATDNPASKLLIEKLALEAGKAVVIGGVSEFKGQVMTVIPGHTTFREIFGEDPGCSGFTPCSSGGVLGPVPGIVASVQATEVLKLVTGIGQPLIDRLLTIDAMTMDIKTWNLR